MNVPLDVPRELVRRFEPRAVARQAQRLVGNLDHAHPGLLERLQADPLDALQSFPEVQFDLSPGHVGSGCSVLGSYNPAVNPPQVRVTSTRSRPQMWFSALHELGHHVQQGDLEWGMAALMGESDRARRLEEQVCEAFAAEILLGLDRVHDIIGDGIPTADSITQLHEATGASRSACAVRVVQMLRADGLAMVATAKDWATFFTVAAGDLLVPRRGALQPETSIVAGAARSGRARSRDAAVTYGNGRPFEGMAGDAVRDGDYVYAVFTTGRPGWAEGSYAPGRTHWGSADVHCSCGESYTAGLGEACDRCSRRDRCSACGRCTCDPDLAADRTCEKCFLSLAPARFPVGGAVCLECLS